MALRPEKKHVCSYEVVSGSIGTELKGLRCHTHPCTDCDSVTIAFHCTRHTHTQHTLLKLMITDHVDETNKARCNAFITFWCLETTVRAELQMDIM